MTTVDKQRISDARVRYAKALTSMEEIRASQLGLAVAAAMGAEISIPIRIPSVDSD